MNDILDVLIRSVVIYLFVIIAIKIFGKKELSQLNVIDLVFILLISNSVQNAMVGSNTSLVGGITAASALFLLNFVLKDIFFKSKKISEFFQGDPIMLVYQGKVNRVHLDRTGISMDELMEAVREHGVEKLSEVDLAVLEVDGNISVLSQNYKNKTTKRRKAHRFLTKQF